MLICVLLFDFFPMASLHQRYRSRVILYVLSAVAAAVLGRGNRVRAGPNNHLILIRSVTLVVG